MATGKAIRKLRSLVFSPVGLYSIAFGVVGMVPFILLPVLTHVLSPEDFGQVTMMLIVAVLLGNTAGLGAHGYVSVRYFKDPPEVFAQTLMSGLALVLLSYATLSVLLALFLGADVLSDMMPHTMWLLALLSGFALSFNSVLLATFQSSGRPALYLLLRTVQGAIEILLCLGLLAVQVGLWARVISYPVAIGTSAALGLVLCLRMGVLVLRDQPLLDLRGPLRFGLPMVPHVLAGTILTFADRMFVSQQLGPAALGLYMAAAQVGLALMLVIEPVNKAFAPWLFQRLAAGGAADKREVVRITYLCCGVLLASAVLLLMVSYFAFDRLVGQEFLNAKPLLPWVTFGFVFQGFYYMVVNYLFFSERTGVLSLISVCASLFAVAILYVAVRQFGLMGAAVAFTCVNAVNFLAVFSVAQYLVPMPWFRREIA